MFRQNIRRIVRQHIQDHVSLYTFITGLFLMGVIFGAVIVNSLPYESRADLLGYVEQFFGELAKGEIAQPPALFGESLTQDLQYVGLIWLLGLSVIGLPLIFLLLFLKGTVLGFTIGFLVSEMGFRGFLVVMVSVFPQNLLIIPVYLFIAANALAFSIKIVRRLITRAHKSSVLPQFFNYGLIFIVAGLTLVMVSAYEAWVAPALIRSFF